MNFERIYSQLEKFSFNFLKCLHSANENWNVDVSSWKLRLAKLVYTKKPKVKLTATKL